MQTKRTHWLGYPRSTRISSFVAAAAVCLAFSKVAEGAAPKVGDKAPEFSAIDSAGKAVKLAEFRGKPVVLVFTRAHW